jgi:hypothetical protein
LRVLSYLFLLLTFSISASETSSLYQKFEQQKSQYIGNAWYCYSDSLSMMVEQKTGEKFSSGFIEVLTGVGLGAFEFGGELYLSNVNPADGIRKALGFLGYEYSESLASEVSSYPAVVGPLIAELLPPAGRVGGDHYILLKEKQGGVYTAHDPAGYPFLKITQASLAAASNIMLYSKTMAWSNPKKVGKQASSSTVMSYFKSIYKQNSWEVINTYALRENYNLQFLNHFTFPVCSKRSLDFSRLFKASGKNSLAELFRKKALACAEGLSEPKNALLKLSRLEKLIESELFNSTAH